MIRIVLLLLIYMIPGLLAGILILGTFPHIRQGFLAIVTALTVGIVFFIYRKRKKEAAMADGKFQELPNWIKSHSVNVYLCLASLLSGALIFSTNKAVLYIDNGYKRPLTVKISHHRPVVVASNYCEKLTVVKGNIEFEYEGKTRIFTIAEGNSVLNVDTQNIYLRTSITYASEDLIRKRVSVEQNNESNELEFIKDEFFNAGVDYMFEAPKTISIKKRYLEGSEVNKKVLYRLSDWNANAEENEEALNENNGKDEGNVVVKPKKK